MASSLAHFYQTRAAARQFEIRCYRAFGVSSMLASESETTTALTNWFATAADILGVDVERARSRLRLHLGVADPSPALTAGLRWYGSCKESPKSRRFAERSQA